MPERRITAGPAEQGNKLKEKKKKKKKEMTRKKKKRTERKNISNSLYSRIPLNRKRKFERFETSIERTFYDFQQIFSHLAYEGPRYDYKRKK